MKRYQFSLATVLRLRTQQAELAQAQLAQFLQKLRAIEIREQQLAADLEREGEELLDGKRTLVGETLVQIDAYRHWIADEIRRQQQEAQLCIAAIQKQNQIVLQALQNQRLLEKLQAHSLARWQVDSAKEEQQLNEEAYMSQWGKRQDL